MKMPHMDEQTVRAANNQSPHHHHHPREEQEQNYEGGYQPRRRSGSDASSYAHYYAADLNHSESKLYPPFNNSKMPSESSPYGEGHRWRPHPHSSGGRGRGPALHDLTHSNVNSMGPPPPHHPHAMGHYPPGYGPPPQYHPYPPYEYPPYAAEGGGYGYPPSSYGRPPYASSGPVSHRGGHGGYSYFHHHPNARPPMPPPSSAAASSSSEMLYPRPTAAAEMPPPHGRPYGATTPPPPHHSRYPHTPYDTPSPPPPPPPSAGAAATPPHVTSYYHDQQYPAFLPPSASLVSCKSEDEYSGGHHSTRGGHHQYDTLSPQSASTAGGSPQQEVNQVGENDVLCGRGAPTNYHPGNEYFRELVKEYQGQYLASKRADKPFIASHIVQIIQSRGGRFLKRYKRNGVSWERGHFVWVEVDPQKAYEKACQALREGAPEIRRRQMQPHIPDSEVMDDAAGEERLPEREEGTTATANGSASAVADTNVAPEGEASKKSASSEPEEDDRNDEMQDQERS